MHAVSSSNVNEKWISLSKFTDERVGTYASAHAINPFMSHEPLPKSLSPFIVAINGSVFQPFETGTTSVWPDKIIGFFPLVFFALIVPKRFTLSLLSSKTLKVDTPFAFKISSQ